MKPLPTGPSWVIASTLFALLFSSALQADPVEDQVKSIRARYNAIEGAKLTGTKVEFESQDEPVSGTCTTYAQGGAVVKVHLSWGAGDHGASDEYYYYDANGLFFVYASDGSWGFTGNTLPSGESETVDATVEHRVYLSGGQIIRHLKKEAKSTNPEALPGLIAKAPNLPVNDPERAAELLRRGQGAAWVKTPADLGALLMPE